MKYKLKVPAFKAVRCTEDNISELQLNAPGIVVGEWATGREGRIVMAHGSFVNDYERVDGARIKG